MFFDSSKYGSYVIEGVSMFSTYLVDTAVSKEYNFTDILPLSMLP